MGRRVRIVELDASEQETSNKYFLWDGLSIVEERNGGTPTTVTSRYFAEGEVRDGTKYFYGRDHLGSVREVVDVSATTDTVVARYDYDPYGRREVVSETVAFDWGFTGHYYHADSGLHLAPFRAYDADLGRWLSRDPLGEAGGINLYEYALSNPVNFVDPLGLNAASFTAGFVDSFTWGLGSYAMSGLGVDGINRCSTAYLLGGLSGFGLQIAAGAGGLVVARALMKGGFKKLLAKFLTKKGPPRSSTIKANKAAGDAWEANVVQSQLPRTQTGIETQITIRSAGPSGKKVRLDAVGKDAAGKIRLTDAKASPDAGFTKNQKVAYPELVTHGGTVAGKGKGAYPGGTVIPPTAVDVIRKVP